MASDGKLAGKALTDRMTTGYVYEPIFLEHDLPSHPENARRLRHLHAVLEQHGVLAKTRHLPARPATRDELRAVHSDDLINRVQRVAAGGGGSLDADTYVAPRSFDAALVAAGGTVAAVEAVLDSEVDNAFALVRPPGHHATSTRAMGFCLFNNVAVAAQAARLHGGIRRVLVVDFDVHHGNGTQEIFQGEPSVFYASLHQYPHYPGTGHWRDVGQGAGRGSVLNVPLPPGVGDAGYSQVWADLVWPLAERFRPELAIVSAGYDAHWSDPLAQMSLSLTGYAWLQRELVQMAGQLSEGRVVFVLEGGYELDVLAYGVLNAFWALLGEDAVADPFGRPTGPERPVDALITNLRRLHGLD